MFIHDSKLQAKNTLPNLITRRIERSIDRKFLAHEKNQRRAKDREALLKTVSDEISVDMLMKDSVPSIYLTRSDLQRPIGYM